MRNSGSRQAGVSLSGLLFWAALLGALALMGMRLFPLYNEKMKVDLALETVMKDPEAGRQTKADLVKAVMKQFEVSDIDRWSTIEFTKLLQIEKVKNSPKRVMRLDYEIRNPVCCDLDIVLNYHREHELAAGAVE
jgi:Domain of unknown function (DUF4845)